MIQHTKTQNPKILLVVGGNPNATHAGEIYLRDLLNNYPREKLTRYALVRNLKKPYPTKNEWMGFELLYRNHSNELPSGILSRRFTRTRIRVSLLLYLKSRLFEAPILAKEILQHALDSRADYIWIFLNSPYLISLAKALAKQKSIPLLATVWDPPERFAEDIKVHNLANKMTLTDFEFVIRNSKQLGVASEGMKEEYLKRFQKNSVILIHGLPKDYQRQPITSPHSTHEFVIGFAGNMYAVKEWQALLDTLANLKWKLEGRQVRIRLLGTNALLHSLSPNMQVEYLGWRSMEQTIDILSSSDLAYLPYWLDEEHRYITSMCFPNKMSIYLAAGIPIFYHGPVTGSPAEFMKKYPVGLGCHSLDIAEIAKTLEQFVTSDSIYKTAAKAIELAIDEELNLSVFQKRFYDLIGLESYM